MNFKIVNTDTWERHQNYNYFTNSVPIKMRMTANVDITKLLKVMKENNLRKYPTFSYIVSKIVNSHDYFKMSINEENKLVVWDTVHPRYPIFHQDDQRISIVFTDYSETFQEFYENFLYDIETYTKRSMCTKGPFPQHCFDLTMLPWINFTDFHCQVLKEDKWFLSVVSIGGFFLQDGKYLLPINLSIHHAVCDGYHVSMFFKEFEALANSFQP